jgi:hypothetical protein
VRAFGTIRAILPLLSLAAFWWLQPEAFAQFLHSGFVVDLGSGDQPRQLFVPTAALFIAPLALRFGLPLIVKAALLLPFAATALTQRSGRGPTFDPARDLPSDSFTPGSQEEAAIDRAIAAALAAREPTPIQPFGRHDAAA